MDRPILPITYEKLDQWIHSLRTTLAGEGFACAIGVLRGGGAIALMVSHEIGAPVAFLRYDRATRHVDWHSSIPIPGSGSKVLVCEDLAGVGHALSDCVEFLRGNRLVVKTLTVGFDDLSQIRPDNGIDGRGYFLLFPWERHSHTDEYREQWRTTGAGRKGKYKTIIYSRSSASTSTVFCCRTSPPIAMRQIFNLFGSDSPPLAA